MEIRLPKMTNEKIIVKVSNPYTPSKIFRQTPGGNGVWKNIQLIMNEGIDECDYWVVLDDPVGEERVRCPRENTFLFALEAPNIRKYSAEYLRQFAHVVSCQQNMRHPDVINALTTVFWMVDKSYDELSGLTPIKKTKNLSIITSNKVFTKGHKKRFDFALKLKDYFKDEIDLFGRGVRTVEDKWQALAPYRYTIAIENDVYPHWVTEKLTDCFLSFTVPFYYGSKDAESYFPTSSYIPIDIENFSETVKRISDTLLDDSYRERMMPAILQSRSLVLNEYNFFAQVLKLIEHKKMQVSPKNEITIFPENTIR